MKSKLIFIPSDRDEAKFVELMDLLPNVNFVKFNNKFPFYTLYFYGDTLYVRKRRDDNYKTRYARLLADDVAALYVLPKEAVKEFLFSL